MKISEFRIGTIFNYNNKLFCSIQGVKYTNAWYVFISDKWINIEYVEPIPLVEDVLTLIGFQEWRPNIWKINVKNGGCRFVIKAPDDKFYFETGRGEMVIIPFIHNLQNIFYTNTAGEELIIPYT